MPDEPNLEDELQRVRTQHALGEVTDEELAAVERRLHERHAATTAGAASLTTRFEAISRGEAPQTAEPTPVDRSGWSPEVVAAGSTSGPSRTLLVAAAVLGVVIVLVVLLAL